MLGLRSCRALAPTLPFLGYLLGGLLGCDAPAGLGPVAPAQGAAGAGSAPAMVSPTAAPTLGPEIPMRRLTREQYRNTVRDLLGISYPALERLAADELTSGFRTNTQLSVQELHVEQYQAAAEEIARAAVAPELLGSLAPCQAGSDPGACAQSFIQTFGPKAYRRPLTAEEAQRLLDVFNVGHKAGFATGVELVVQAALQSPHFLYRPEFGVAAAPGARSALSSYEMASRLSYLLWNTMPDGPLFAAAAAGELTSTVSLTAHAERMLSDERASGMWSSFAEQWLGTDAVAAIERDEAKFPSYSTELRSALAEQTGRYFDAIARRGDGLLTTLLTSRRAPLRGPLFQLYGATPTGPAETWQDVELPADQRSGLLTLAPFMAANSHADQTSLVRRGFMIRTKLLCTVPPPPPPDVDADVPAVDPNLTARERFALHRSNPTCAGCHALMDPLGLPFELYDPLGAYRTVEGAKPIDATGALTGTAAQDGDVAGPIELVQRLASADEVTACVTKQLFRYAFSRVETAEDQPTLTSLTDAFRAQNRHLGSLLGAIASSEAFRAGPSL